MSDPRPGSPDPADTSARAAEAKAAEAELAQAEIEAAAEREREAGSHAHPLGETATQRFVSAITGTNVVVTLLALVSALILGAIVVVLSDDASRTALGYVTARPSDFFSASWDAVSSSYRALLSGSLGGVGQLSETLVAATPLIATGLGVAIPLRAGLFNIGAEGQVIAGGLGAGIAGFLFTGLPLLIHLPLAVLVGIGAGALMGWLPGFLKARTGAHEVISTIMLNNTAALVVSWALTTSFVRNPERSDPISKPIAGSARFPRFPGMESYRVNFSLILVLLLAVLVFWLLERSTTGFELSAVGANPRAATAAGMSPNRSIIVAMAVGGAMAGVGGIAELLGIQGRITDGFSAGLGFDGITVALLGRGSVGGTVAAGLLFGALKAGGRAMQAQTGTSLDLVSVIQGFIIVFIAAPGLVKALYRIEGDELARGQLAKGWGS